MTRCLRNGESRRFSGSSPGCSSSPSVELPASAVGALSAALGPSVRLAGGGGGGDGALVWAHGRGPSPSPPSAPCRAERWNQEKIKPRPNLEAPSRFHRERDG